MAYLLQWVMIYSFGINTDLQINPNSIPYTAMNLLCKNHDEVHKQKSILSLPPLLNIIYSRIDPNLNQS